MSLKVITVKNRKKKKRKLKKEPIANQKVNNTVDLKSIR